MAEMQTLYADELRRQGEAFYDRIVTTCKLRGVSPSGLCVKLGIRKSFLSDLKSGRIQSIHTSTVCTLAEALGVSTDYLLLGKESRLTDTESLLLSSWRHATDKEKQTIAFILADYGMKIE